MRRTSTANHRSFLRSRCVSCRSACACFQKWSRLAILLLDLLTRSQPTRRKIRHHQPNLTEIVADFYADRFDGGGGMMTAEEIRALFERRAEAWARHDADALSADYTEDAILYSPTAGTVSGLSAIKRVYRVWMSAFADLICESQDLIIAVDRVVQTAAISGTDTGGFLGFPPTGKLFNSPFVCLFDFRGNQIVCERRFLDRGGFLLQLVGDAGIVDGMHKLYQGAIERARLEYDIKLAADIQAA